MTHSVVGKVKDFLFRHFVAVALIILFTFVALTTHNNMWFLGVGLTTFVLVINHYGGHTNYKVADIFPNYNPSSKKILIPRSEMYRVPEMEMPKLEPVAKDMIFQG